MLLALSVISSQAAALGPTAYKVFDDRGGSIGRLESNDWTLPDPEKFVSSRHAAVRFQGGAFYLEDTSTNGTYLNQHERPMDKATPVRLQDGDRIFIGDYEILVQLIDDGGATSGLSPVLSEPASAPVPPVQAPGARAPTDAPIELETVDPLVLLGSSGSHPRPQLSTPMPVAPPPPAPTPPPAASVAAPVPPAPVGNTDRTQFRSDAPRPPPPMSAAAAFAPEPSRPTTVPPAPASPIPPAFTPEAPPHAVAPQPAPAPAAPAPMQTSTYSGPAPAGSTEILTALGLDPTRVDPAIHQQLGDILRIVVQGLVEVLQARAEIKNNFRMPMTSLRPVENNPLKFSMNADDALHNLFVKRNPGYLPPVEAFREGFQDISHHQIAMLAGIRAAFNAMLARFHPDHLEEIYERKLKQTSLIPVGGRLKYWDMYRSQFEDIERDAEAHFQLLFGEAFARAYHEQLQKLANAARGRKR